LPNGVIKVVGNKKDLVTDEQILKIKEEVPMPWNILTSAKMGENVEEMFIEIGNELIVK
jgi:50S ribosomal subunit-associated GTPase HflX